MSTEKDLGHNTSATQLEHTCIILEELMRNILYIGPQSCYLYSFTQPLVTFRDGIQHTINDKMVALEEDKTDYSD